MGFRQLVGRRRHLCPDCPLTNPPPEIAAQGNEAILNYFVERARGAV
jgi:hypothetical protein